jgi:hypothetical protein
MDEKIFLKWAKRTGAGIYWFLLAANSQAQALTGFPELSPVKLMILILLDGYGLWKILQCVKNALDHLADSSKGDTTAKDRVWNSVLSIIGILMVGVILNFLILKAGEFGARPVSSVLSGE